MSRRIVFVLVAVSIMIVVLYWSTVYREEEEAGPPYSIKVGGEASGRSGDIELKLKLEVYQENDSDKLRIIHTLINHGEKEYLRVYWAAALDVKVYSKRGRFLGYMIKRSGSPDMLFRMYLKPGEERTKAQEWFEKIYNPYLEKPTLEYLKPGKYKLAGVWFSDPWIETSKITMEIRHK